MKKVLLLLAIVFSLITHMIIAQVPSNVPKKGLVGYWPFNNNANDESGNGNNGTVYGATLTTDRFGNVNKAYNFSGSDWIELNSLSAINTSIELAVSIWVKSTGFNSNTNCNMGCLQYYFSRGFDSGLGFGLSTFQGDNPHFSATVNGPFAGGQQVQSPNKTDIPHTQWHHLLMNYDGTSINFYVDGLLSVTTPYTMRVGIDKKSKAVFGRQFIEGSSYYTVGIIDDAAIWNRALTNEEIGNLFSENSNNVTKSITSLVEFNTTSDVLKFLNNKIFSQSINQSDSLFLSFTGNGKLVKLSNTIVNYKISDINIRTKEYAMVSYYDYDERLFTEVVVDCIKNTVSPVYSTMPKGLNSGQFNYSRDLTSKELEIKGPQLKGIAENQLINPVTKNSNKIENYQPLLGYMISDNGCRVLRVNPDVTSVTWSGPCKDSLANGKGILKYYISQKETFSYEGEVLNGNFHGYGKCTYTDGDKYEGEFKDNTSNGYGTYYSKGKIHKGQFKGGMRDGQGTTIYQDGDNFVGEWKDDKANGKGKYTYSNGSAYTGVWSNGNLVAGSKEIVLVEESKQKFLAENSKQESSQTKNLEAFAAFLRGGNSSNNSSKPNNSSNNSSSNTQTQQRKCFNCKDTRKCGKCSQTFSKPYYRGSGKYEWRNESRAGLVMCSQCHGRGHETQGHKAGGWEPSKDCYVCIDGWVSCIECNSNGNGKSIGQCQKCYYWKK